MCSFLHRFLVPAWDCGERHHSGSGAQDFGLCYQNSMTLQSWHKCILRGIIYGYTLKKAARVFPLVVLLAASSPHFINC